MYDRTPLRARNPTSLAGSFAPLAVIAVVVSALALHAIVYGPSIRERADRLQVERVAQENRALCDRLGMGYGSERFTACAEVLSEARRQEATRVYSEVAGIL
jgi:hypothetical protein